MTRFRKVIVTCPYCANEDEIVIWERVDVAEDPDLKERLLKKDLQAFSCSNCQESVVMAEPLLYLDPTAKQLIYYCPQYAELLGKHPHLTASMPLPAVRDLLNDVSAESGDFNLRLACTYNDLIEKLHLETAGFDDRLMEVVKLALRSRLLTEQAVKVEELYFLTATDEGLLFQFTDEEGTWQHFSASPELYQNACDTLASKLTPENGWALIGQNWALDFVNRQA